MWSFALKQDWFAYLLYLENFDGFRFGPEVSSSEEEEEEEEEIEDVEMTEMNTTREDTSEMKKTFSLDRYLQKVLAHKKEKTSALLALEDLQCGLCGDVFDKPVMFKVPVPPPSAPLLWLALPVFLSPGGSTVWPL